MSDAPSSEPPRLAASPEGELGMLLDRLQRLLQRQLELARQGHEAAAVDLFDETDRCVRGIAGSRGAVGQGSTPQWQCIERLYRELSLALTSQRTEVLTALNAVRRGKKVLSVYGSRTTGFPSIIREGPG
jgi:hypothetical protein